MTEFTQGAAFDTFGLSEATLRAVRNKGYELSTPVQAGCIPPMMAGKDVIAKAPTGTGKTMAFGIPIIERIDPTSDTVQAVILAEPVADVLAVCCTAALFLRVFRSTMRRLDRAR